MAVFTMNRKDLYEEIWSTSLTKTAEKHEISYTRLLTACRKYHIPTPPPGYSTKLEFGKAVKRTPLPESEEDTVTVKLPAETKKEKREHLLASSVEALTENIPEEDDQDKVTLLHYGDRQKEAREELYRRVWEKPVTEVAREEQISDVALRKRCKALEVPLPPRGYWAKLNTGKPVHKTELTKRTHDFPKPHTGEKRQLRINPDALSFMKKDGRFEILKLASILRVNGPGAKMMDEIQKLYQDFREWHKPAQEIYMPGDYHHLPRRQEPSTPPFLAEKISKKTAARVFHILDAITKALLPYEGGFTCRRTLTYQQSLKAEYDYWFSVNGERVSFSISETKDQIVHEITQEERMKTLEYKEAQRKGHFAFKPRIPKYDEIWSGRLRMTVAGKTAFEDCRAYMLEDRIGEILIALFEASYPARLSRLQEEEKLRKEIEEFERQIEEGKKQEQIREQYNNEVQKTRTLLNKAQDYETACSIRQYIDAIRSDTDNPDNNPEWIEWANKKADWYDPTIAREDELFGKRKHELNPDQKAIKRIG